jgi:hypothetical protein
VPPMMVNKARELVSRWHGCLLRIFMSPLVRFA